MNSFILLTALHCLPTVKINNTKEPWTKGDLISLATAKKRCPEITQGRSPCLKTFTKMYTRTYRAMCTWRTSK